MPSPNQTQSSETLTLIGAGLVGSLLATFLARRGYRLEIFERRPDMRKESISAGRSINLAVSVRGLHALRQLGLEKSVLDMAVPMRGRMMHAVDGTLTFQRYGRDDSECINSVSRGELNKLLMTSAERTGNAQLFFNQRAAHVDLEAGNLTLQDERTGEKHSHRFTRIIGTDGSASVVRAEVLRLAEKKQTSEKHYSETYLDYGYKELVIPAGAGGKFQIEQNALHIWPRGTYMLIALPNRDGSFTCTLFLPMEGPLSFATLTDPASIHQLFQKQFPDALSLIAHLETSFFENPTGRMVTIKCQPWNYRDRALLLGDAAHAIVPFFGQGMNCGFEDCTVFEELISELGSLESAFGALTGARKTHADAIADMAVENFVEMRDKVANPRFLMEKGVERILQEKFPGKYVSRYALVTFSREPYRLAYEMGTAQAQILDELCHGIDSPEEVDLALAEKLIRTQLSPLFQSKGHSSNGS